MAENTNNISAQGFKEAICIDANRVFDSCCDRDCLEDLRCYFTPEAQAVIADSKSVRVRSAEVLDVNIDVEPVNFNRGFYSCDITFFFIVEFDLFTGGSRCPEQVKGIAYYNKKVILYGGEGSVKIFSNSTSLEDCADTQLKQTTNTPRCMVQAVDPVALSAKICEVKNCYESACRIPECVCRTLGSPVLTDIGRGTPTIYATLGLFTIVQLVRNVQVMIPIYDYCIPDKQCTDNTDGPCDIFRRIKFPTDDFFPPHNIKDNCCGCTACDDCCSDD